MTTNQTIDGVPRELLELAYLELVDTFSWAGELRALLDAPAAQWLAMEVNGKPWVIKEGPNAEKWRAMGYELFPVDPAAQPQGKPAHQCQKCNGRGTMPTRHAGEGETDYRARCKLYAEQPAPVAVVLPEQLIAAIEAEQARLSEEDYMMDSDDCVNVIREEVTRLSVKSR